MAVAILLGMPAIVAAKGQTRFTSSKRLARLEAKVGAQRIPIETPCADPVGDEAACRRRALDRVVARMRAKKTVRVLQLGDSHIASDYITGMIRHRLQAQLGDGGRGFVHADQGVRSGGRRIGNTERDWMRDRIVDRGREGRPYGFSGMSLISKRKGARLNYRIRKKDRVVRVYLGDEEPGAIEILLNGKRQVLSAAPPVVRLELPREIAKASTLTLVARRPGVPIYGLAFDGEGPGIIYESVGPVGADARVYLDLERDSFKRNLAAHRPDLVVLMVGGNDALKVRKKWRTLDQVEAHHRTLIELLRKTLPEADVMVWSPMDAGDRRGGRVVSKERLVDVRRRQKRVVDATGVAYWDAMGAMGGPGSIARWHRARIMNADLVHPRKKAADLLGALFADAFLTVVNAGNAGHAGAPDGAP